MPESYSVEITPGALCGKLAAIPSKSDAHRKLICSALSTTGSRLDCGAFSADIKATINCLRALGAQITEEGDTLNVSPVQRDALPAMPILDCGESGSTLRFMLPVVAALGCGGCFEAKGRLPQRPLEVLREALSSHGMTLSPEGEWPLRLEGQLPAGEYTLPGNVSSQYFSGLLLGLSLLNDESLLKWSGTLESAAYVGMTLRTLALFGVPAEKLEHGWRVPGSRPFQAPVKIKVEGDWSNAAFWLVAGALNGDLLVSGLDPDSLQADRAILDMLRQSGANIDISRDAVSVKTSTLHAIDVDAAPIPDLIPIWAVAAALSDGITHIHNAARLRIKESDRLSAISDCLEKIGADVQELSDALIITGKTELTGGSVESYNDHRIAMSMAVAACKCRENLTINNAEAVNKSYPGFFEDYQKAGGNCHVINNRN